jgi:uncharacterized membrane protein YhhN
MEQFLEWLGCATGLLGAGLLALKRPCSRWGFVSFLISNFCWIGYGYITHTSSIVLMQLGFTATSLVGVWSWFGIGETPWVKAIRKRHGNAVFAVAAYQEACQHYQERCTWFDSVRVYLHNLCLVWRPSTSSS